MLLGPGLRPVGKTTLAAALLGAGACALQLPAAHGAQTGGAGSASALPSIASVACSADCGDGGAVARGGTLTLRGTRLDRASAVVFLGGPGSGDDARVGVRAASGTRLSVRVPAAARSGQIALETPGGVASQARRVSVRVVRPATPTLDSETADDAAPVLAAVRGVDGLQAGVATRRVGKGVSAVTVAYASDAARAVRVDVVRRADGMSIFQDVRTTAAGERESVAWDGRTAAGVALDGRYELRISAAPASAAASMRADGDAVLAGGAAPEGEPAPAGAARLASFTFLGAVFPVQGAHDYGGSSARFGAGRAGHVHEGQDVLAKCGTPVVAARGGIVKQKAFHSAAGNYVVISDALTGQDHGYMHFRAPAVVDRGERVETGQVIGAVGSTGSSTACHLHFEIWTAPGWYAGGSPIDPLETLKRWDRLS